MVLPLEKPLNGKEWKNESHSATGSPDIAPRDRQLIDLQQRPMRRCGGCHGVGQPGHGKKYRRDLVVLHYFGQ
jgi:hypothetical protein